MSALIYFLNVGLDTDSTTYALACMKKIDRAIKRNRSSVRLPSPSLILASLDQVDDLLEVYYFNIERMGVRISTNPKEEKRSAKILYLDESLELSDTEDDTYEENYRISRHYCQEALTHSTGSIVLHRPRESLSMNEDLWLFLMFDLSSLLEKRYQYQLSRGLHGTWILKPV